MSDLKKKKPGRPKKVVVASPPIPESNTPLSEASLVKVEQGIADYTNGKLVDKGSFSESSVLLRAADDSVDAPRKTFKDIFADFDINSISYTGELQIIGLNEALHPCLVTQTPKDIEKITRLGYKPLDEVQSLLGETIDGNYQHSSGTRTKWYVCLKSDRDARHAKEKSQREYVDKMTFLEDKEQPTFGNRTTPPPGYSSDGTSGFF